MKLDPQRLMSLSIPTRSVSYEAREPMLYALSVGLAADLTAPGELAFVYEPSLRVVPSFANSLAFDDSWLGQGGIDLARAVHGSLQLTFHAPLPAAGKVDVAATIVGLSDKGEGRGGIVLQETGISDDTGRALCTSLSSIFVRGAGGFGGSVGRQPESRDLVQRAPDVELDVLTLPNQALLFRLLGDRNALHADPAVAAAAGFDRPILHGACTYGIACATLLRQFCSLDPAQLAGLEARFAGPLYPGETLRFAFWRDGDGVAFRAKAKQRDAAVLDNGFATFRASS
jgi:acyl dehydratase